MFDTSSLKPVHKVDFGILLTKGVGVSGYDGALHVVAPSHSWQRLIVFSRDPAQRATGGVIVSVVGTFATLI